MRHRHSAGSPADVASRQPDGRVLKAEAGGRRAEGSAADAVVRAAHGGPRAAVARMVHAWQEFWFAAVSPIGLHTLRVLSGLLFLAWLLPFAGNVDALFGLRGWFDSEAYLETSRLPVEQANVLLNWSLIYIVGTNSAMLQAFYWGALAVFALFTFGVATRVTSVLTWLFVVSFQANPAARFDADYLLGILALYLMIGYLLLGQWSMPLTWWERILGTRDTLLVGSGAQARSRPATHAANFAIRLLQVHVALIVVTSGLHKLQHAAWWSGTALWYPLHTPFSSTEAKLQALVPMRERYLVFLSVLNYAALAWQLSFPVFAWRQGWMRLVLFGGAAVGWLTTWFVYDLPLFGPFYLIGCVSFLTAAEWTTLLVPLGRLAGRVSLRRALPCMLAAGVALAATGCPPRDPSAHHVPAEDTPVAHIEEQAPPPEKPVSPVQAAKPVADPKASPLQIRVDAALQTMRDRVLLLDHSFWTVFHEILGVGPESAYLMDYRTGERIKAIDYICNGGALRGMTFLDMAPGQADVLTVAGSGTTQGHQDQCIAEMVTEWGIPLDKGILVQGKPYTFKAFTRYSRDRTSVKAGQELSWAIIIIATYYGTDVTWTNLRGETVHFEDVVDYELHQPIKESPACGGTHRLFGLTWALHLYLQKGGKVTGVWQDVEKVTGDYKRLAHELQNPDGSFSTEYFRGPGNNRTDLTLRIHSSGHILEWLALALTDEELRSPWMENAANALAMMILDHRDQGLDGGAVYHAAHALEIYRNRVFGPTPHPPVIPLRPR